MTVTLEATNDRLARLEQELANFRALMAVTPPGAQPEHLIRRDLPARQ
jgi:hypothetical protein